MPAALIPVWAVAGFLVGMGFAAYRNRSARPRAEALAAPLLTAVLFSVLAWRFGVQFDLLPYSVFAGVGVMLGLVDLVEQRLPSALTYVGIVLVVALLVTSAALDSHWPDLVRALTSLAILTASYLALAVIFAGNLGAGDVKLSGLLGLVLGWQTWSAVITGTFLGWLAAALAWVALRATRRREQHSVLPLGPFLLAGAFAAVIVGTPT